MPRSLPTLAATREVGVLVFAIIVALVFALLAMALAFSNVSATDRGAFWLELGKAGMQTLVVAVIGAFITAALKYAEDQRAAAQKIQEQERERMRRRNEYRLGLLRRLRKAYSEIKRVRRDLQIAGLGSGAYGPLGPRRAAVYARGWPDSARLCSTSKRLGKN